MPVRKIKKNYRNVTGVSSATKAIGDAQFESTLERDFIRLAEFSPDIAKFEVQPVKISWVDATGTERTYTPDVLVTFSDPEVSKPWLCEVKYRADLKKYWPDLHPKFIQGIRYAKQRGWRFRLITEVEIRGPELEAAKFLLPFRHKNIPPRQVHQVLNLVEELKITTPAALLANISSDPYTQAEWIPALWLLVAQFRVGINLQEPLSMTSRIWSLE